MLDKPEINEDQRQCHWDKMEAQQQFQKQQWHEDQRRIEAELAAERRHREMMWQMEQNRPPRPVPCGSIFDPKMRPGC